METDESMPTGSGHNRVARRTLDSYARNFAAAESDRERGRTDAYAMDFVKVLVGENPRLYDFWAGYYEGRKRELGLIE